MSVFSETGTISPFHFFRLFSLTQSALCQHYFLHFQSGFPDFVERFFRLHKIPVLSNHKKAPSQQGSISIPNLPKRSQSFYCIFCFHASIPVTAAGIAASVSYNKKLPFLLYKIFLFSKVLFPTYRFFSRNTDIVTLFTGLPPY